MERPCDIPKLVHCTLDIGEAMLVCGGEISRVEDTISRILYSYGAERVDVFTIITCISLSVAFPGNIMETQIRRVRIQAYATDFTRLERLNALSRDICASRPPVSALQASLVRETAQSAGFGIELFRCAGCVLAGGAFTMFFGGTYLNSAIAMVVSLLIWWIDRLLKKLGIERLFFSFLISFLAGIAALLFAFFGIGAHTGQIMMGVIMLLIPGIAITNSMRDVLIGDTISGILRLVEALLVACFVAAGFGAAIWVSRGLLPVNGLDTMAQQPWVQVLMASLGAIGFGLMFKIRYRWLPLCLLGGGLTWTIYLVSALLIPNAFLNCAIAAAFGAVFAEVAARICKAPATVFLIPAEISLIPGGALYITMHYLVGGEEALSLLYATRTVSTALAIALGIVLIAAVTGSIASYKRQALHRRRGRSQHRLY